MKPSNMLTNTKEKNSKYNVEEEMEMESVQAKQMEDVSKFWKGRRV